MNVFGYCRATTQALAEAIGIDKQKESFLAYASKKLPADCPLYCLVDKFTARDTPFLDRPAVIYAMQAMSAGDHLVIPLVQFAFKNLNDLDRTVEFFASSTIVLHFVELDISSSDPAMERILRAARWLAFFQKRRTAETVTCMQAEKAALGEVTGKGQIPYPMRRYVIRNVPRLVYDPKRKLIGEEIYEMHIQGKGVADIARIMKGRRRKYKNHWIKKEHVMKWVRWEAAFRERQDSEAQVRQPNHAANGTGEGSP